MRVGEQCAFAAIADALNTLTGIRKEQLSKKLYTAAEAAEMLGVTKATVGQWIRDGKLGGRKAGRDYRIAREELSAFVQQQAQGG